MRWSVNSFETVTDTPSVQEPVAKQILRRKWGWTHPQEASIQHHTPSPDMEPAGEKEEGPASQQLEAGH
nr:hypothetical protein BaRGS_035067 [Batillaria attramentaria]